MHLTHGTPPLYTISADHPALSKACSPFLSDLFRSVTTVLQARPSASTTPPLSFILSNPPNMAQFVRAHRPLFQSLADGLRDHYTSCERTLSLTFLGQDPPPESRPASPPALPAEALTAVAAHRPRCCRATECIRGLGRDEKRSIPSSGYGKTKTSSWILLPATPTLEIH